MSDTIDQQKARSRVIAPYCPAPPGTIVGGNTIRGPRMSFQWHVLRLVFGHVLDVGCADDPNGFGHRVVHFDYDDWSQFYQDRQQCFVQGDAHKLLERFPANSFELVILGDVVEHFYDPYLALSQAAQVTSRYLCMTIWEEWRGPGGDEQLQWSIDFLENKAHEKGYPSSVEMYAAEHPGCDPNDNAVLPHLEHCQRFTDQDVELLVTRLIQEYKFQPRTLIKAFEVTHEDHDAYCWMVLLEKS